MPTPLVEYLEGVSDDGLSLLNEDALVENEQNKKVTEEVAKSEIKSTAIRPTLGLKSLYKPEGNVVRQVLNEVSGSFVSMLVDTYYGAQNVYSMATDEGEERDKNFERILKNSAQTQAWVNKVAAPTYEQYEDSWLLTTLPSAVGSMLGFWAGAQLGGGVAGVIGKGAAAAGAVKTGAQISRAFSGGIGASVSGALPEGIAFAREAYVGGKGDLEKAKTANWRGMLIGMTEGLPIGHGLYMAEKSLLKAGVKKSMAKEVMSMFSVLNVQTAKRMGIEGLEELIQETGQTMLENWQANEIWDASRGLFDHAMGAGSAGFVTGALMTFLMSGLGVQARFNQLSPEQKEAYIRMNEAFSLDKKATNNPAELQDEIEGKAIAASLTKAFNGTLNPVTNFEDFLDSFTIDGETKANVKASVLAKSPNIATETMKTVSGESSLLNILLQLGKKKAIATANEINKNRKDKDKINLDVLADDKIFDLEAKDVETFSSSIQDEVNTIMTTKRMDKALGEDIVKKIPEEMVSDIKFALAMGLKGEALAILKVKYPKIDDSIKNPLIEKIEAHNNKDIKDLAKTAFDASILGADKSVTDIVAANRAKVLEENDIKGLEEITKPTTNAKNIIQPNKEVIGESSTANEQIKIKPQETPAADRLAAFFTGKVKIEDSQTERSHDVTILNKKEAKEILQGTKPEESTVAFDESGEMIAKAEVETEKKKTAAKKIKLEQTANAKIAKNLEQFIEPAIPEPGEDVIPDASDLEDASDDFIITAAKVDFPKFQKSTVIDGSTYSGGIEKPVYGTEVSVGDLLKDFKGSTIKELYDYILEQEFSGGGVGVLLEDLISLFPGMKVEIASIPRTEDNKMIAGVYQNQTIFINSDRILTDTHIGGVLLKASGYIAQTLTHELLHAYLGDFIENKSLQSRKFVADMHALINSIKTSLTKENPEFKMLKIGGAKLTTEYSELIKDKIVKEPKTVIPRQEDGGYLMLDGKWMLLDGTRLIIKDHIVESFFTPLPEEYLESVEEFLAYAFTEQGNLRKVLQNLEVGVEAPSKAAKRQNGWRRYVDLLVNVFKNIFVKKKKDIAGGMNIDALDKLAFIFDKYTPDIVLYHLEGLSRESKYLDQQASIDFVRRTDPDTYRDIETTADLLDKMQMTEIDDETADETSSIDSVRGILAETMGITKDEVYRDFSKLTYVDFVNRIELLNKTKSNSIDNFLRNLYKYKYKDYANNTFEEFKDEILTRTLRDFRNRKPQNFISLNIDKEYNKDTKSTNVVTSIVDYGSQRTFTDDKGRKKDIFQEDTVLTNMINDLNSLLGLPEGTMRLAYVESVTINKTSHKLRDITTEKLGMAKEKTVSSALTKIFEVAKSVESANNISRFLYLGNFGGKGTFAVIKINESAYNDLKLNITPIFEGYMSHLKRETQWNDRYMPALLRAYIWDMWFNNVNNSGEVDYEKSIVNLDYNKLMKRGGLLTQRLVKPLIDPDLIGKLTNDYGTPLLTPANDYASKNLKGVRYDIQTGKVLVNTYAWQTGSTFMTDLIADELEQMGYEVTEETIVDINRLGTAIADGASFYVFGHFDKVYRHLHGKLKIGAMKNVYASSAEMTQDGYTQSPHLFIKHALHGISANNPIGAWMIRNQIGVLTSNESAKEGIGEGKAYEYGKPFDTDMSNYFYIKDENDKGTNRAAFKQTLGTSGLVHTNTALSKIDPTNKAVKAALKLVEDAAKKMNTKMSRMTDDQFFEKFMRITMNPTSYQGRILSRIYGDLLNIPEDEAKAKFSALIDDPVVAEQLNLSISAEISATIEHRFTGARAALNPDMGSLLKDQVRKPIELAHKLHISNRGIGDPVFVGAVPNRDDRVALVNISALQKQKALTKNKRAKLRYDEKIKLQRADIRTRHPNFKFVTDLIETDNPIVKEDFSKYRDKRINPETGRIEDGFVVISEDIAVRFGIKPGDKVITFITPTDSMLGVTVVEVAGIARSSGDKQAVNENSIIMNSEYIQSIVGKDFDIDTIGIVPFSNDWQGSTWEDFTSVVANLKEAYLNELEKTYAEVLKNTSWPIDGKISRERLFGAESNDIMIAYAQEMLGERTDVKKDKDGKIVYDPFDDFDKLNDDYLIDVAPIISERRKHTLLSSIGFSLGGIGLDNDMWFKTHVLHLIMTNHTVDAPANTHIFEYNGNFNDEATQSKLYNFMWGDESGTVFQPKDIKAMNQIYDSLFGIAIKFMKNLSIETSEKMNLFEQMKAIKNQKEIFALIEQLDKPTLVNKTELGQKALSKLQNLIHETMERKATRNGEWKLTQDRKDLLQKQKNLVSALLPTIGIKNLYNYPLFNTIKNIDITTIPLRGLTYQQHVRLQNTVVTRIMEGFPDLSDALEKARKRITEYLFQDAQRGKLQGEPDVGPALTSESLMSGTPSPHFAKVMAIMPSFFKEIKHANGRTYKSTEINDIIYGAVAITTAYDETNAKENLTETETRYRDGRAIAFTSLFKTILTSSKVETNPKSNIALWKHLGKQWGIYKEADGSLTFIKVQLDSSGEMLRTDTGEVVSESMKADEILNNTSVLGKEWYKMLFAPDFIKEEDGILYTSASSTEKAKQNYAIMRMAISTFIPLQKNITVDDRILILKDFLLDRIYLNESLTLEERALFWLSIFPQENLGERNAVNLIVNKMNHAKIEARPTKFQTNTVAKELMKVLDPELFQTFIEYQGIYQKRMFPSGAKEVITPTQIKLDLFGKHQIVVDETNTDFIKYKTFEKYMERTQPKEWVIKRWFKFNKAVKEDGYNGGYKALQEVAQDIAIRMAFTELGIDMGTLKIDLDSLTGEQFDKKYNKFNSTVIDSTYKRYTDKQKAILKIYDVADESQTDQRLNNLEAYHWMLTMIAQSYAKNKDEPTNFQVFNKMIRNIRSMSHVGPDKEVKNLSFENENAILARRFLATHSSSLGEQYITAKDVMLRNKDFSTRKRENIGEVSLALTKMDLLNEEIKYISNEMREQINGVNTGIETIISLAGVKGVDNQKKFLNENLSKTKRDISIDENDRTVIWTIDWLTKQIQNYGEDKTSTATSEMEEVYLLAQDMSMRLGISMYSVEGQEIYIVNNVIQHGLTYMQFVEMASESMFDVLKTQGKVKGEITGKFKLRAFAALKLRYMFDIQAKTLVQNTIAHLDTLVAKLDSDKNYNDPDSKKLIESIRDKFVLEAKSMGIDPNEALGVAFDSKLGNYVTRKYDKRTVEILEKELLTTSIYEDLQLVRSREKLAISQKKPNADAIMANKTNEELVVDALAAAEEQIEEMKITNEAGDIANMMIRRKQKEGDVVDTYIKNDPQIFQDYINDLVKHVQTDIVIAEAYVTKIALIKAGNPQWLIEDMGLWFSDQVMNKNLSSKSVSLDEITKGQEINFVVDLQTIDIATGTPMNVPVLASGIFKQTKGDSIELKVNTNAERRRSVFRSEHYSSLVANAKLEGYFEERIGLNPETGKYTKHIADAVGEINTLSSYGYITKEERMLIKTYGELYSVLYVAYERALTDLSKFGKFNINSIRITDEQGIVHKGTKVRRYRKRGITGLVEAYGREHANAAIIDGAAENVVPIRIFRLIQSIPHSVDYVKHVVNWFVMGGPNGVPAFLVNWLGATKENLIDSPLDHYRLMKEWKAIVNRIKYTDKMDLNSNDRAIYSRLNSLGFLNKDDILDMAMAGHNVSSEELLLQKPFTVIVTELGKATKQSYKYKKFRNEMAVIHDEILRLKLHNNMSPKYAELLKQRELKLLEWQAHVNGLLKYGEELSEEKQKEVYTKMYKEAQAGTLNAENFAEKYDLTPVQALRMLTSKTISKLYTSKSVGVGLQATAEKLRLSAYGIGYLKGLRQGYNEVEAHGYGQKMVERAHVIYDNAHKQKGSNTKGGKLMMMYSTYKYGMFKKFAKQVKDSVPNFIKHKRRLKSWSDWPAMYANIKGILNHNIELTDQAMEDMLDVYQRDAQGNLVKDKGGRNIPKVNLSDSNISGFLVTRMALSLVSVQIGSTLLYGLSNSDDPVGQAFYDIVQQTLEILGEEDKTMDTEVIWAMNETLFWTGIIQSIGINSTLTAMSMDWETAKDRLWGGRFKHQTDFLSATLPNTTKSILHHSGMFGRLDYDEKRTLWSPKTFDKMLGVKLIGYTRTDNEWIDYRDRFPMFLNIFNWLPWAEVEVFKKAKK